MVELVVQAEGRDAKQGHGVQGFGFRIENHLAKTELVWSGLLWSGRQDGRSTAVSRMEWNGDYDDEFTR